MHGVFAKWGPWVSYLFFLLLRIVVLGYSFWRMWSDENEAKAQAVEEAWAWDVRWPFTFRNKEPQKEASVTFTKEESQKEGCVIFTKGEPQKESPVTFAKDEPQRDGFMARMPGSWF